MLVLSRKVNQRLRIGNAIVTICSVDGGQVKIGIEAPPSVDIVREEVDIVRSVENPTYAQDGRIHPLGFPV